MAAQTTAWVNFNGKDVGVKVSIEGIEKSLNKMQRNGKKDIDSLSASFKNLKSSISQMSGSMGSLPLIGGLGAAGIFAGGKTAVEKFAGRETLETAITFFSKTEDVAKSNLSYLKNTSNSLGIVYDVAEDGYKRLLANMSLMNIPMSEQNDKFLKISSAIRAMGLDAGQSESVFRAFGDMMAKGSIQAQELKTQLANAMPGTMGYMAKAVGGNAAKVAKMLDKGAISWAKYGDKLIDIMYESTKGGLDKAVLTTSARLARIQNTWDSTMVGIGDAIVRSGALDVISQMGKELEVWVSANKEMIASSIKGGVDFVKKGFEWAVAHKDEIGSVLKSLTAFTVGLAAVNLVATFSDPIKLAAGSMVVIGTAISQAMKDLDIAREQEKARKNKNNLSDLTPMSSGSAFWGGTTKLFQGTAGILTRRDIREGIDNDKSKNPYEQIFAGIMQMAGGAGQKALELADYMGGGETYAAKLAKQSGQWSMMLERNVNPEDFQIKKGESSLSRINLYDKDSSAYEMYRSDKGLSTRDTIVSDTIAIAVLKGMEQGLRGITVNVDSAGNATVISGATKGPAIKIQNND